MVEKNPLVSIVIPVYNTAAFVEDTIQYTLQQTYKNIELILVDDGSKDNSYSIIKKYEASNVKIVRQQNKGASAARNHGISLADGEYIQYLDADDLLHPQKIEHQIATLQQFTTSHLIGGTWQRFINNLDKKFGEVHPLQQQAKDVYCFNAIQWLIDRPMMIPNTWLVSRKLIDLAGPWNEEISLNDDGEYFYRVIAKSTGLIIDRRAATYYRSFNSNSLSSTWSRKAMLSWIKSIQSYKRILQEVAGDKGNDSSDAFFFRIAYWCLNEYPDLVKICKAEMYQPNRSYDIEDKLVSRLANFIGLGNAKRTRKAYVFLKELYLVRKLINKTKGYLGKPAY